MTQIARENFHIGSRTFDNYSKYREAQERHRPSNANAPWSKEHEQELYFLKEVKRFSDDGIAKHFQRTVGAIERRIRLLKDQGRWMSSNQVGARAVLVEIEKVDFFKNILNGVDPNTGEEFNSDSVWMHPQIQRDILRYMIS